MTNSIEKKHTSCHRTCSSHDDRVGELPCFTASATKLTNANASLRKKKTQHQEIQISKMAVVISISLYLASCCDVSLAFSHGGGVQVPLLPEYGELDGSNYDHMNRHQFSVRGVPPPTISTRSKAFYTSSCSSTQLAMIRKKKPMPIIGYSGDDICAYYDRRPLVVGWRLNILSLPLLGKLKDSHHISAIAIASSSATHETRNFHSLD